MKTMILTRAAAKLLDATRSRDKTRAALAFVNVRADVIEATDGKMLVQVPHEQAQAVPAGVYKIVAIEKCVRGMVELQLAEIPDVQFPDCSRVVPPATGETTTVMIEDETILAAVAIKLFRWCGNGYSDRLLERLAPLGACWTVYKPDADKPARFQTSDGIVAVIMPFDLPN